MFQIKSKTTLTALTLLAFAMPAVAGEHWLKVMDNDPWSKEGSFHMFDIDSAFEDDATGYVAARMTYQKPDVVSSTGVPSWYVWAFDCKTNKVFYVSSPDTTGTKTNEGWRNKGESLAKPVMGGVTNTFGKKLCALKGSWPKGQLP